MKHADLIRTLRQLAKDRDLDFKAGGGSKHEKWLAGEAMAIVPRHKEIGEHLARRIIKDFEEDLEDLNGEKED
ncbi:hypothetical protein [Actinomadura sp. GTD37]|uniref:hypothetical protein n=1 Tax=Actinomadura sp. GTD37 TaxID=1778030 RepID=UPI0035BFB354